MILQKCLKNQRFLTSFRVHAVQLEKKIGKGAYDHFENNWGSVK